MNDHSHSTEKLVLKLEKGEPLVASLISFLEQNQIEGGWVSGLGAVSKATLGNYNLAKKKYSTQEFKGNYELASLVGNIALLNGKPIAHLHAVLANDEFQAIAGHLEEAIVAATCEIVLEIFEHPIYREFDPRIGLNLIA